MEFTTLKTSRLIVFMALTFIIQWLGLPQPFTGPLINMMLLMTTLFINPLAGILLGVLTPVSAAIRGQLPSFLIPMIPFIAVANAIYILSYSRIAAMFAVTRPLISIAGWAGLVVGSVLKFGFLFLAARFLLPLLVSATLPQAFIAMMSTPQLITALAGGALAFFLYEMLQRRSVG